MELKEMVSANGSVYMVFDYMAYDLTGIMGHPDFKYRPEHIKCILKQILDGMAYLHRHGILHRDIKGALIVDSY